jgi:hypothetical protein
MRGCGRRRALEAFALVGVAVLLTGGCASPLTRAIEDHVRNASSVDLDFPALLAEFQKCMEPGAQTCIHGAPPKDAEANFRRLEALRRVVEAPGVSHALRVSLHAKSPYVARQVWAAHDVLSSRMHAQLTGLTRALLAPTSPGSHEVRMGLEDTTTFARALETSVALGAWERTAHEERLILAKIPEACQATVAYEEQLLRARSSTFVASYLEAYFRGGRFIEAKVDLKVLATRVADAVKAKYAYLDAKSPELARIMREELLERIRPLIPEGWPGKLVDCVEDLLQGKIDRCPTAAVLAKIEESGFVSRAGKELRFPGISLAFDPLAEEPLDLTTEREIDFGTIGSELVRVFLEAVGDALFGVPGVGNATGVVRGAGLRRFECGGGCRRQHGGEAVPRRRPLRPEQRAGRPGPRDPRGRRPTEDRGEGPVVRLHGVERSTGPVEGLRSLDDGRRVRGSLVGHTSGAREERQRRSTPADGRGLTHPDASHVRSA